MRALSTARALQLPVRLHGIRLGRPVDLLLDPLEWRVLGLEVLCGDATLRFLAWPAATVEPDEIVVDSALMLLEDVEFYRRRARSLRSLLGESVDGGGALRDLLVAPGGAVVELVVEDDGAARRLRPDALQPAASSA